MGVPDWRVCDNKGFVVKSSLCWIDRVCLLGKNPIIVTEVRQSETNHMSPYIQDP